VRRSFHLTNLLVAARPGELARTKWADLTETELRIGGGDLKMKNTVTVPLTPEIKAAIAIAGERGDNDALIWPGCTQASRDDLPATGMALRRTYKTTAASIGIDPDISQFLMGHAFENVSQGYIVRWVLQKGSAVVEAQHKISATITAYLHAPEKKRAA
jgi:integrase